MAFVPLIPVTLNLSIFQGLEQINQAPLIQSPTLTNIDLSAWTSLTATAIPVAAGPCTQDVDFGTVSGAAAGVLKVTALNSDFSGSATGTAKLVIKGKPTSGDEFQILASGTFTLNPA